MVGIYKITNKKTNQCYIGQSIHIEQRWREHKYEAKNENNSALIYQAIRKYGIENFSFEILEECELNEELLNQREKYWIAYYNSFSEGYNMTTGGQGSDGWTYNPDDFKELWDAGYTTKQIADMFGCCIQLVTARLRGYKDFGRFSGHTRTFYGKNTENIHQYTLLGEYVRSFTSIREAERELKVQHSNLISDCLHNKVKSAYGFQWSYNRQNQILPVASAHGKLVQCIETGEIFPNTGSAAKKYGLASRNNIVRACNSSRSAGKHPITGEKLHWRYIE